MSMPKKFLKFLCLCGLAIFPASANPARADIVTVLFTGFLSPVAGSGMEALNLSLKDRFASNLPAVTYSGQAFEYTQREEAMEFINSFDNIEKLFLIGHSFGASSAIQLAGIFLAPENISVDLTFQIESVDNPLGSPPGNVLPANVHAGYNYYQISTGLFEPQGETFVQGATNINTEVFFNDPTITHTSIDDDVRLHAQIFSNMQLVVVPEPASLMWITTVFFAMLLIGRRPERRST